MYGSVPIWGFRMGRSPTKLHFVCGIAEVARRAGVSPATASRALTGRGYVAEKTRLRVQQAARELGYVASSSAATLATGRTDTIGVVMPTADRWFFAEVLSGIQDALIEHRHDLALYGAPPESAQRAHIFDYALARKRFDGIIAVGIEPSAHEMERLIALGKPLVSVGGHDLGASSISIDDLAAGRVATEHLIDLGHTDIVFLGGDHDGRRTSYGDALRLEGYQRAMVAAGLADYVRHHPTEVTTPGSYTEATRVLGDRRSRPTGIVAVCDEVAVGTIIAARRLGVAVPNQLSVVGIDDHEYADMFGLTTIQQRPYEQGRAAVQLLMWQLDSPDAAPQRIRESAPLYVRNSTFAVDVDSSAIVRGSA